MNFWLILLLQSTLWVAECEVMGGERHHDCTTAGCLGYREGLNTAGLAGSMCKDSGSARSCSLGPSEETALSLLDCPEEELTLENPAMHTGSH